MSDSTVIVIPDNSDNGELPPWAIAMSERLTKLEMMQTLIQAEATEIAEAIVETVETVEAQTETIAELETEAAAVEEVATEALSAAQEGLERTEPPAQEPEAVILVEPEILPEHPPISDPASEPEAEAEAASEPKRRRHRLII